jgi:hypothetical protein
MDQTAFVVQPAHHELVMAYSFGGAQAVPDYESRHALTVAQAVSDAYRPEDGPLEGVGNIDYRSGMLYLRVPRQAAGSRSYTLFKNPTTCLANASGASICRK